LETGLRGKTAIVTGGSRGIGRAIARALAAEGVSVAICARTAADLEAAAREIAAETGSRVLSVPADMRRPEEITGFVTEAVERLGGLDILVNNAVESTMGLLTEMRDEDIAEHINVKVMGYLRCARAAIPHLKARGGGNIVMIGGMALRLANPGAGGSGLTNAALTNVTKFLATQLAPDGIRVNIVHPAAVYTERLARSIRRRAADRGVGEAEILAETAARVPIGRMVTPEDIAHLAVFLCTDLAGAITGQSIGVDGGGATGVYY
jgi:NAD(P)-dependent dehydrogenase (short-subunit alcohol dehydrogenase family)